MAKRLVWLSGREQDAGKPQLQTRFVGGNVQRALKQRRRLRRVAGRLGASGVALEHARFQRTSAKAGRVVDIALKRVELALPFRTVPKPDERGAEREPRVLVRRIERERLP